MPKSSPLLLISFCNVTVADAPLLAVVDTETGDAQIVDVPRVIANSAGITGFAFADGCLYLVSQGLRLGNGSIDPRPSLFVVGKGLDVQEHYFFEHARDPHSLVVRSKSLWVASTGTDEIVELVIQGGRVTAERAIWGASDERADGNHLNAICRHKGSYVVSGFGPRSDESWASATSGFLKVVESGELILGGLQQPHSLVALGKQVAFCESRRGVVRLSGGGESPALGGYARGLAKVGESLFAGVSRGRLWSRSRGTIENPGEPGDPFGHCSVFSMALDLRQATEHADLSHFGQEIYDLAPVPPSMRLPLMGDAAASRSVASKLWTSYERASQQWRERIQEADRLTSLLSDREAEIAALRAEVEGAQAQLDANLEEARAESGRVRGALQDREREVAELSGAVEQLQRRATDLRTELEQAAEEREYWRRSSGDYEQDRDRWQERAGNAEQERASLRERLAAAEAQREAWQQATDELRRSAEQLEARLQAELEQLAQERENWRTTSREYEQDRDRWQERAGNAEQERASLRERLEAAEAQREAWEQATEEVRRSAEQLEARLSAELEQLEHEREHWCRRSSEYEQDRDRWQERAGNAEKERVRLNERLEAALAAAAAAAAQRQQLDAHLQAELEELAQERENLRKSSGDYEQDRDRWQERAGNAEKERVRLNERLEAALAAAAAAAAQRQQLEARLSAELEQLAHERENWRTTSREYEQDRDRWQERAGNAEQERASLRERLEAAEAQREAWEQATEEVRRSAEQLEARLSAELEQREHEREHWRRSSTEYEQDRDRWQERAESAEQALAKVNERLEALAAADAAEKQREAERVARDALRDSSDSGEPESAGGLSRRWLTFSQFGSWLLRGKLGYLRRFFALRRSFDADAYLAKNRDVVAAGLHPLLHYIEHGEREGRALEPPPSEVSPVQTPTGPLSGARPESGASPDDIAAYLERSGLIDEAFYRAEYPEVGSSELTPAQHYCWLGWREGRRPNPYFDPAWYVKAYPDAAREGTNPLWHYIITGETRRPCPFFDPAFYARRYGLSSTDGALADFLRHRQRGEWRDPVELFDAQFYLANNEDVAGSGGDPFLHYLSTGHREGRDPSLDFSTVAYRAQHLQGRLDCNPLLHHHAARLPPVESKATPALSSPHAAAADEVRRRVQPGPDFEEFDPQIASGARLRAKVIAFYLPQFHAIPENDHWWGKGFTEWSNVARGYPRYADHYQPRLPRDLGFYDLGRDETLTRQVELARAAGIHGFSFYYYWFDGKRLLERPLERLLADPTIDFPFCLTWANENWTRRWDGHDDEILISQSYDPGHDIALIDDLQRHFEDPRYIRLQGRPLFLLYRVDCIPDAAHRIERWRELWQSRHGEEPLIFVAQAFGAADPSLFGVDGAFEFPPHKLVDRVSPINQRLTVLDPAFGGHVVAYEDVVREALTEPPPSKPFIRTAVPSWDNDARRQGEGLTLHGSTPALYEQWVRTLADSAASQPVFGEPLIFINAWNEWAEGAYLEPDVHYGGAYLNATARAVSDDRPPSKRKVLLVGHDAHRHGAQMIVQHIGETLRNQFGCDVAWLLLGHGAMVPEYEQLGRVWVTDGDATRIAGAVADLRRDGFDLAVTNTTLSGAAVPHLKSAGFRVVSLIHELPGIIGELAAEESLAAILEQADTIVVPAEKVAHAITSSDSHEGRCRIVVRPQGLYKGLEPTSDARASLRSRLGLAKDTRIVLNVGFGDMRKGIDTFVHVARFAASQADNLHFLWVGNLHRDAKRWLESDLGDRIHLLPYVDDVAEFYFGADVFFLSSREDPFPSVVLEAMSAGLPVVAQRGVCGMEALIAEHGRLVERNDLAGLVDALAEAAQEGDPRSRAARARVVAERFRYDDYCFDLLQLLEPELEKVSVVVPNYNYAQYLASRLDSIFDQTYPVFETIVLDDRSTDDSLAQLEDIAQTSGRRFRLVANNENTGSPFTQWERGCRLARGKYVWVAEADDESDVRFLEEVVRRLRREAAGFAFSDSMPIDHQGNKLAESYKDYYREAVGTLMDSSFTLDAPTFVERCLGERNLVLNVSAVVWDRAALVDALVSCRDVLQEYLLVGDWHLYATVALRTGRVGYVASSLNVHRRHDASVTASVDAVRHVDEVERVQDFIAESLVTNGLTRERMRAYADRLREQLGVVTPAGNPVRGKADAHEPGHR